MQTFFTLRKNVWCTGIMYGRKNVWCTVLGKARVVESLKMFKSYVFVWLKRKS